MNWESFLSIFSPLLFYPGCPNFILPSRSNHTSTLSDFHHPEKVCAGLAMCCTCNVLHLQCATLPMCCTCNVLLFQCPLMGCAPMSYSPMLSLSHALTPKYSPIPHFERNPHYPESHSHSVYHFHPSMFHEMISRECRPSLSARVSPVTLLHFSIDSSNVSRECRPSLSAR